MIVSSEDFATFSVALALFTHPASPTTFFVLIMGVIGGFVGGWLSSLIFGGNLMNGITLQSILVALVGAIIVIAVYRLVTRRAM